MSMKKTYSLNSHKQLVDLNGDTTNFDLTFTATSKDGSAFEVLVVDQTTLDNTPNLEYKRANGTISGNIVSDKNVYQNYFLILKSDKPCDVEVDINKREIAPKPVQQTPPPQQLKAPPLAPPQKPSGTNWKIIFILAVVIGGGALLYYMYTKQESGAGTQPLIGGSPSSHVHAPSPVTHHVPSPAPASFGRKANESLIARLNNLPMR